MSAPQKIAFSIPAGEGQEFPLTADVLRLDTFPSGLLAGFNSAQPKAFTEGFTHTGKVTRLRIENSTVGTLVGEFTYGAGNISLPGVAAVIGTIQLPSGASTSALQTTGNTTLASILAGLAALATSALQTTGNTTLAAIQTALGTANGYLLTLSQPRATLHECKNFAGGGAALVVPAGARYLAVLNTHASLSITVQPTGGTSFTLAPGQGVDWPLLSVNHSTGYPATTISGATGATANVAYIL